MAKPDSSGLTKGRHEHYNPEEAEENILKYNFVKILEPLKRK